MTFAEKICEAACEGAVLIKNQENTLPLMPGENTAVFGRMQKDFLYSGMGSGGSVHVPYTTNLIDELLALEVGNISEKQAAGPVINRDVLKAYEKFTAENPFDNGGGRWAGEPWSQKEMKVSDQLASSAAKVSSKALFVISRNAGEDKDLEKVKGAWYLSDTEWNSLKTVCMYFTKVAVIFNTCGIMDTGFINHRDFSGRITAALYVWQGGMEGGRAAARLITGNAVPSGKLADTIARDIEDYPSTKNFGNEKQNIYAEDIYAGYRYFTTFAKDRILYPFGFGLSYTEFDVQISDAEIKNTAVKVTAIIKNTGSKFAGKETLQLYLNAPQGKLGKSERVLAAFGKTKLLLPGESQQLTLSFNIEDFASYDDSGITGFPYAYVLEEGDYCVLAGTDSESAVPINPGNGKCFNVKKTYAVQQLSQAAAPTAPFQRIKFSAKKPGTFEWEDVPLNKVNMAERIQKNLPPEIPFTGDRGIKFDDVKADPSKMNDFIAQLDEKQLSTIVRGEGMMSAKVTMGITAAFGGLSESLHGFGIPAAGCADGPSGLRLDTGREASLMPTGTLLACTWNLSLIEELYEFEGKELAANQIDTLLGPGMNIHRSPLNGRNFEYFSEDPFLTGKMAAAELKGLCAGGSAGTVKHFACNNQERFRNVCDSAVSERALREIYLKGFEIAVKSGNCISLMTSYNPINGHWAASNYDTVNTILRREWNYTGLVMTDWWAKMNDCIEGGKETLKNTAAMLRAGNDIYMIVDNDGAESNGYGDNISECLRNGRLTRGELQYCVKNILNFILHSPVSARPLRALKTTLHFESRNVKAVNEKTVFEKEDFNCTDSSFILSVDHEGIYNISGTYIKYAQDLSQSVCNIMIDGAAAASLECRSTAGKEVTVNAAQVGLKAGTYRIELVHTKPGIEVKRLSFSSEVVTPVSMGLIK